MSTPETADQKAKREVAEKAVADAKAAADAAAAALKSPGVIVSGAAATPAPSSPDPSVGTGGAGISIKTPAASVTPSLSTGTGQNPALSTDAGNAKNPTLSTLGTGAKKDLKFDAAGAEGDANELAEKGNEEKKKKPKGKPEPDKPEPGKHERTDWYEIGLGMGGIIFKPVNAVVEKAAVLPSAAKDVVKGSLKSGWGFTKYAAGKIAKKPNWVASGEESMKEGGKDLLSGGNKLTGQVVTSAIEAYGRVTQPQRDADKKAEEEAKRQEEASKGPEKGKPAPEEEKKTSEESRRLAGKLGKSHQGLDAAQTSGSSVQKNPNSKDPADEFTPDQTGKKRQNLDEFGKEVADLRKPAPVTPSPATPDEPEPGKKKPTAP